MNYKDFVYYCKHKMHMKEYHYEIESNINRYNAVRILLVKKISVKFWGNSYFKCLENAQRLIFITNNQYNNEYKGPIAKSHVRKIMLKR